MDKVMEYAEKLNVSITESSIYKAYVENKEVLKNDKASYEKYKGFYEVHLNYQLNIARGNPASFDEEKYVSSLYSEIMLIENTRNFLNSRNELIHLLNNLNHTVFKNILL